ncbi:hypothetical protein B296_00045464 [Ensete ventricosum]|uniref:Uncharacterized protein n=1 Tax=Ensete ventricosum TaxID=4639 RepID=A0A426XIP3_ENSVE|nr:hypothetical protein B296_00045464 [Ensete ventricosum]
MAASLISDGAVIHAAREQGRWQRKQRRRCEETAAVGGVSLSRSSRMGYCLGAVCALGGCGRLLFVLQIALLFGPAVEIKVGYDGCVLRLKGCFRVDVGGGNNLGKDQVSKVLARVAIPDPVAISMVAADDGSVAGDDGGVGDDHSNCWNCLGGGGWLDGSGKGGRAAKRQDHGSDTSTAFPK